MKNNMDILKLPLVLIPLMVSVYVVIIYFLDMKSQKLDKKDMIKQAVVMSILISFVVFLYQESGSQEEIFSNPPPF